MNILIINNDTKHLTQLKKALADHRLTVQKYRPGIKFDTTGKDLVILSGGGGEGKEVNDQINGGKLWYADEIEFIKRTRLPVLGVCMGFELIAQAYGAKVKKLPRTISGWRRISLEGKNPWKLTQIRQFESHDYYVPALPASEFDILGRSSPGAELIKHKHRPVLASQFHPEIPGGSIQLKDLISAVIL